MVRTVGDVLVDEIIAHPDDDGLRLILADWFEDAGQTERAEFIRDQVLWLSGDDDYDLLDLHLEQWLPGWGRHDEVGFLRQFSSLPGAIRVTHARGEVTMWRLGFIEQVSLPLAAWLEHGPTVAKAHPLTRVVLTDLGPAKNAGGLWVNPRSHIGPWVDRWGWCEGSVGGAQGGQSLSLAFALPHALFSRLPRSCPASPGWRSYSSEKDALDALSAAAIMSARLDRPAVAVSG